MIWTQLHRFHELYIPIVIMWHIYMHRDEEMMYILFKSAVIVYKLKWRK